MMEGIALVLAISLIVRVFPSLIGTRIDIPPRAFEIISIAVFINMFVYCFFSEALKEAIPAALAFLVIVALLRQNLLLNILLSSAAFMLSAHFLQG